MKKHKYHMKSYEVQDETCLDKYYELDGPCKGKLAWCQAAIKGFLPFIWVCEGHWPRYEGNFHILEYKDDPNGKL